MNGIVYSLPVDIVGKGNSHFFIDGRRDIQTVCTQFRRHIGNFQIVSQIELPFYNNFFDAFNKGFFLLAGVGSFWNDFICRFFPFEMVYSKGLSEADEAQSEQQCREKERWNRHHPGRTIETVATDKIEYDGSK